MLQKTLCDILMAFACFVHLQRCNTWGLIMAANCRFGEAISAGRISRVEKIDNCCVLAAVGHQMASRKGVAATMFSALAKANINIRYAALPLVQWLSAKFNTLEYNSGQICSFPGPCVARSCCLVLE